jgi:hypothetical protein
VLSCPGLLRDGDGDGDGLDGVYEIDPLKLTILDELLDRCEMILFWIFWMKADLLIAWLTLASASWAAFTVALTEAGTLLAASTMVRSLAMIAMVA